MTDRVRNLAEAIIGAIQDHRTRYFREPGGIFLSIVDAQELSDAFRLPSEFAIKHVIRDGDTGILFGLPFTVDGSLQPGSTFIGHKVAVASS